MWAQNDGTLISPQGHKIPQQIMSQQTAKAPNPNFNKQNGTYDPDDEIDESDSEFYDDSDYENDSELENEAAEAAMHHNILQQMVAHNAYVAAMQNGGGGGGGAVDPNNYNALNALGQLSSMGPNYNAMQGQNVSAANHHAAVLNALSQMSAMASPASAMQGQGQRVSESNHPMLMNALTASMAPTSNAQHQRPHDPNHHAVNTMPQRAAPVPVVQRQPTQSQMHGHHVNVQQGYPNTANTVPKKADRNGNENIKSDEDKVIKHSTPIRTVPARSRTKLSGTAPPSTGNTIRPRKSLDKVCRREASVDLYQIRRMEFEETFTTDESGSSSPIKDITSKFKHLRLKRPNFFKIFQRNKSSTDNLAIISAMNSDLPVLRDSTICTEAIQDGGKSQLQKISEVLLKPSDNVSTENTSSSYEKSIQAFLFRSNFPEHFLGIRLLKLSVDDVQQLIRQIDLLENVQDKLTETVQKESLSGPALMSCDLIELKKSLDLNLGHWTIFEQLITGLRQMQYEELMKMNTETPICSRPNLAEEISKHPERVVHENVLDDPHSEKSSVTANEAQKPQPIVENIQEVSKSAGATT